MTISKGGSWGQPAPDSASLLEAADDAELAAMAAEAHQSGGHLEATVSSGDVLRTLGLDGLRPRSERIAYPMDLGYAVLGDHTEDDGLRRPFVAHVTARRLPSLHGALRLGPGIVVAVMNAPWLGDLRLGPKAHLNDGRLDITEGQVPVRHRGEATRRARSGSHLPHPDLRTTRTDSWSHSFSRPTAIWLDNRPQGRFRSLTVELVPDALTVVA